MSHRAPVVLSLALLIAPAFAQTAAQLTAELQKREKEAVAKKDADALFETGKWADSKALGKDAKRLYAAALKLKPDHAGANEALGNKLVEGKWLPAKEAEAALKKAMAAEMAAKGMVEVDGVWVDKEHVADAKKGVFHHDNERVTKADKLALQSGKVRHPATGELIDAKFLDKAKENYFPVGGGRWVDQKEADSFHSDRARPWFVRSTHATVVSTLPFAKIGEFAAVIDQACERLHKLFGNQPPNPLHRPVVMIASTENEFTELGTEMGDETSATSAFLMREEAKLRLSDGTEVRATICNGSGNYGPYAARHAAAMGFVYGRAEDAKVDLPLWLLQGSGSLASRFATEENGKFYAQRHLQRGAMSNLKAFFSGFAISGEMENDAIAAATFEAGLVLRFAEEGDGGDKEVAAAWADVASVLRGEKSNAKAIAKLEQAVIAAEAKLRAFLQNYAK
jgi:hypothetical protein